jgi:ABC-type glutathione transport system ATPase component
VTGQDFPAIANLADFVYVLDTGAVVGQGEPDDVTGDTRVQAAFLRGVQPFPPAPPTPPDDDPPDEDLTGEPG